MFRSIKKNSGTIEKVFIDRDSDVFKLLITYLRNNFAIPPIQDVYTKKLFEIELDYWGVKSSNQNEIEEKSSAAISPVNLGKNLEIEGAHRGSTTTRTTRSRSLIKKFCYSEKNLRLDKN